MALIQCPECEGQVSSHAFSCPHCGFPMSQVKSREKTRDRLVSTAVAPLSEGEDGVLKHAQPISESRTPQEEKSETVEQEPAVIIPSKEREPVLAKEASTRTPVSIKQAPLQEAQKQLLNCPECEGSIAVEEIQCSHCHTLVTKHYCSHCSQLIPDHSKICPLCGKNDTEHFRYASWHPDRVVAGAIVAAVFSLFLFVVHSRSAADKPVSISASNARTLRIPSPDVSQSSQKDTDMRAEQAPANPPIQDRIVENTGANPVQPPTFSATYTREAPDREGVRKGHLLNNQGYELLKQGRLREAIPLFRQSVNAFPDGSTDPYYAYALFNLARALRMAGKPDLAIPVLEKRIKIDNQRELVARELSAAKDQADAMSESGESESPQTNEYQ